MIMYDTSMPIICFLYFFNDTATTEISTFSLHDALPVSCSYREATCHSQRLFRYQLDTRRRKSDTRRSGGWPPSDRSARLRGVPSGTVVSAPGADERTGSRGAAER